MTYIELCMLIKAGKAPNKVIDSNGQEFFYSEGYGYVTDWLMEDMLLEDLYTMNELLKLTFQREDKKMRDTWIYWLVMAMAIIGTWMVYSVVVR